MKREEAIAEVEYRQAFEPDATWLVTKQGSEWGVARIGLAPTKPTGTATKPSPDPPLGNPHSPVEHAVWLAGTGG